MLPILTFGSYQYNAMYHIYILENCSNSYFVGITNDFKSKLEEHKQKLIQKGKKCEKLNVLFIEYFQDAIRALSKFRELNSLSKEQLEARVLKRSTFHTLGDIAI